MFVLQCLLSFSFSPPYFSSLQISRCCLPQECCWNILVDSALYLVSSSVHHLLSVLCFSHLMVSTPQCDFLSYQQKCVLSLVQKIPDVCPLQWRSWLCLHSFDYFTWFSFLFFLPFAFLISFHFFWNVHIDVFSVVYFSETVYIFKHCCILKVLWVCVDTLPFQLIETCCGSY